MAMPSRRSTRAHSAWNVPMATSRPPSPTSARIRSRISAAALLVNVTARICHGLTPLTPIRYATRWASTRVLPEPAPARMSSGPSVVRHRARLLRVHAATIRSASASAPSGVDGAGGLGHPRGAVRARAGDDREPAGVVLRVVRGRGGVAAAARLAAALGGARVRGVVQGAREHGVGVRGQRVLGRRRRGGGRVVGPVEARLVGPSPDRVLRRVGRVRPRSGGGRQGQRAAARRHGGADHVVRPAARLVAVVVHATDHDERVVRGGRAGRRPCAASGSPPRRTRCRSRSAW